MAKTSFITNEEGKVLSSDVIKSNYSYGIEFDNVIT